MRVRATVTLNGLATYGAEWCLHKYPATLFLHSIHGLTWQTSANNPPVLQAKSNRHAFHTTLKKILKMSPLARLTRDHEIKRNEKKKDGP